MVTRYSAGRISKLAAVDWPGDELVAGMWTREQLEAMDEKFCRAMTDALERGLERLPNAAPAQAA